MTLVGLRKRRDAHRIADGHETETLCSRGAVGLLDRVPARMGAVIKADASHAFLQSMHVAFPIAGLVVLGAVVVTLRYLPARAPGAVGDTLAGEVESLEDALPDVPDQPGLGGRAGGDLAVGSPPS